MPPTPPTPRHSMTPSQVIVAEPFPAPPDNSGDDTDASATTTFVAAFAMPNTSIPNNTDLRNFLVPMEALESVAGMRFLGSASGTGVLDDDAKTSLDKEAIQERERAGVPALPADWGEGNGSGYRQITAGGDAVEASKRRLFRHLCTATSCVGV